VLGTARKENSTPKPKNLYRKKLENYGKWKT
jgi:hypothetical protein